MPPYNTSEEEGNRLYRKTSPFLRVFQQTHRSYYVWKQRSAGLLSSYISPSVSLPSPRRRRWRQAGKYRHKVLLHKVSVCPQQASWSCRRVLRNRADKCRRCMAILSHTYRNPPSLQSQAGGRSPAEALSRRCRHPKVLFPHAARHRWQCLRNNRTSGRAVRIYP